MIRRSRFRTQEEIDVAYWQDRVVAAVTALDAATADLLESKRRLRVCQERLEVSRRPAPTPIAVHPKWRREESA